MNLYIRINLIIGAKVTEEVARDRRAGIFTPRSPCLPTLSSSSATLAVGKITPRSMRTSMPRIITTVVAENMKENHKGIEKETTTTMTVVTMREKGITRETEITKEKETMKEKGSMRGAELLLIESGTGQEAIGLGNVIVSENTSVKGSVKKSMSANVC